MTSHELAQRLLLMPDLPVMARDCVAYRDVGCYQQTITQQDEDDHSDCYGMVGMEIIVL